LTVLQRRRTRLEATRHAVLRDSVLPLPEPVSAIDDYYDDDPARMAEFDRVIGAEIAAELTELAQERALHAVFSRTITLLCRRPVCHAQRGLTTRRLRAR
jgi:D-ribose pyranose/furanose isomerase RbsD